MQSSTHTSGEHKLFFKDGNWTEFNTTQQVLHLTQLKNGFIYTRAYFY